MKDRGSAATEYLSTIGLFLFVLIVCIEAYVAFSVVEKVDDAARTGARVASMSGVPAGRSAAERAMPGWVVQPRIEVEELDGDRVRCKIFARVPLLFKGVPFDVAVTRQVEMPVGG
ncbi:TadE/TadG family type IV pilus assembly protein [Actinomadura scrupuli]|uniref:TadE/TadG family type IV pilus assembly protein n=1 Tax=Actinomadura scrupuli TaxID=559629 RepID=UPI003D967940